MKYFDPYKQNYGYTVEDIFPFLPTAKEEYKSFIQYTEKELSEIETRHFYDGCFEAPNYMGTSLCRFKFTLEVDIYVRKGEVKTYSHLWVEFI